MVNGGAKLETCPQRARLETEPSGAMRCSAAAVLLHACPLFQSLGWVCWTALFPTRSNKADQARCLKTPAVASATYRHATQAIWILLRNRSQRFRRNAALHKTRWTRTELSFQVLWGHKCLQSSWLRRICHTKFFQSLVDPRDLFRIR